MSRVDLRGDHQKLQEGVQEAGIRDRSHPALQIMDVTFVLGRIRKRLEDFVEIEKKLKDKYRKKIPHMPLKKESAVEDFDLLEDFFIVFLEAACKI